MSMRVLHLITWLVPGGIERWLLSMLRSVNRSHVEMDICCKGAGIGPLAQEAQALGARVYHCPLRPTHLGYIQGLTKIMKLGNYDIVHNHLALYSGVGVFAARRSGFPVISSFHSLSFPAQVIPRLPLLHKLRDIYGKWSINYALSRSDLITGCSQAVLDSVALIRALPPDRTKVLYYGVEVSTPLGEDERRAFREELGIREEKVIITNVASFRLVKNHAGLIRVAEQVISQDRRAHFVLVGDGPLRPEMEALVEARALSSHFSFLGIRSDVERLLGCSDIFFFTSFSEGLGLVILEAMAAGLPVVASDLAAFKETVVEGETGFLWPLQDEAGLASRLLDFVVNPNKRQDMGQAGRERVKSRFSLEQAAKGLCQIYESVSNS